MKRCEEHGVLRTTCAAWKHYETAERSEVQRLEAEVERLRAVLLAYYRDDDITHDVVDEAEALLGLPNTRPPPHRPLPEGEVMDGHIHQKLVRDTQSQMHVMVDCELCAERGEKLAGFLTEIERLKAQLAEQDARGLALAAENERLREALGEIESLGPVSLEMDAQDIARVALTQEEE